MQFELSTPNADAATLAAALQPIDPDARIALDATRGRLEVLTVATTVARWEGELDDDVLRSPNDD